LYSLLYINIFNQTKQTAMKFEAVLWSLSTGAMHFSWSWSKAQINNQEPELGAKFRI